MRIIYLQGDLLNSTAQVHVNAINKRGIMGAGIAAAFRKKYPTMFESYVKACNSSTLQHGAMHAWIDPISGTIVANLLTVNDDFSGNYHYCKLALYELADMVKNNPIKSVAIPPIGCGIGNLRKDVILDMIVDIFGDLDVELQLYNF